VNRVGDKDMIEYFEMLTKGLIDVEPIEIRVVLGQMLIVGTKPYEACYTLFKESPAGEAVLDDKTSKNWQTNITGEEPQG